MARELNGVDIAIIVFGSLLLACGKYISCIYNERLAQSTGFLCMVDWVASIIVFQKILEISRSA